VIYSREFSMPNSETFSLPPVSRLLDRYLTGVCNQDAPLETAGLPASGTGQGEFVVVQS